MRRIVKRLPTPAMIVAVVALVLALGGSAIAGGVLTTKKYKNTAVRGPVTYVTTTLLVNNQNAPGQPAGVNITASCPSGFFPTGGGAKTASSSNLSRLFIQQSYPSAPNGWTSNVFAGLAPPPTGGTAESISTIAACVKAKSSNGVLPSITL
jgi:hypothetical protein